MSEEITYGTITTEKIIKNVFIAKTISRFKGREIEVEMKGSTAEIAREKLELFLQNKPYSHLK